MTEDWQTSDQSISGRRACPRSIQSRVFKMISRRELEAASACARAEAAPIKIKHSIPALTILLVRIFCMDLDCRRKIVRLTNFRKKSKTKISSQTVPRLKMGIKLFSSAKEMILISFASEELFCSREYSCEAKLARLLVLRSRINELNTPQL